MMHPYISQIKKVAENNKSCREASKKQLLEKLKRQQRVVGTELSGYVKTHGDETNFAECTLS